MPDGTERAEMTEAGARVTEIDGMSQLTYHTHSQFGGIPVHDVDDGASRQGSQAASVYTKPFTVQSAKGSEKSKLQQSMTGKPASEAPGKGKAGALLKKKDRRASNVPEGASDAEGSHEVIGTVKQTERSDSNPRSSSKSKELQSKELKPGASVPGSILKKSAAGKSVEKP